MLEKYRLGFIDIINVREFMIRLETNLFSNPTRLLLDRTLERVIKLFFFSSLFQHPYPSEDQKKQLAQDTGLTILQVNNW